MIDDRMRHRHAAYLIRCRLFGDGDVRHAVIPPCYCGKCASTLGLDEQERHRRLEPGVSTRQSLVNRTGGDHGPVRKINGKEPYGQCACYSRAPTAPVRQGSVPAVTRARLTRVATRAIDERGAAGGTARRKNSTLRGTRT